MREKLQGRVKSVSVSNQDKRFVIENIVLGDVTRRLIVIGNFQYQPGDLVEFEAEVINYKPKPDVKKRMYSPKESYTCIVEPGNFRKINN